MHLLIYVPPTHTTGRHLLRTITTASGHQPIDTFDSLESLTLYLRKPISAALVAILLPKNNTELSALIKMRHLLRNMRIVLILPNREEHTIADGHTLRPRYVSHGDGDLSDVVAVVQKMTGMHNNRLLQAV
jgi:hypothetical protein